MNGRPTYIHDPHDTGAAADIRQIKLLTELRVDTLVAVGDIRELTQCILWDPLLLIPTRPDRCTPLIQQLQVIARGLGLLVQPVSSFLAQHAALPAALPIAPGTVAAAPTTGNASVSGQPFPIHP